MLLKLSDVEFLSKYLTTDDASKGTNRLKVPVDKIPQKDKERLLRYDEWCFSSKGYHLITDWKILKKE